MSRGADPSDWMLSQAFDMLRRADRLHRQFFRLVASGRTQAAWEPPADVFEDEREIVVVVAMPGVAPDQVQVILESGMLTVRGSRPLPLAGSRHIVRRLELPYGVFERRIPLPGAELEACAPELALGCLVLHMRKTGTL